MGVVLAGFFSYHLRLAWKNRTTNESFKEADYKYSLEREESLLKALIIEAEEWQPPQDEKDALMQGIAIDGESLPRTKQARIQKLKELHKDCEKRTKKLAAPYKPVPSLWKTIMDILEEE